MPKHFCLEILDVWAECENVAQEFIAALSANHPDDAEDRALILGQSEMTVRGDRRWSKYAPSLVLEMSFALGLWPPRFGNLVNSIRQHRQPIRMVVVYSSWKGFNTGCGDSFYRIFWPIHKPFQSHARLRISGIADWSCFRGASVQLLSLCFRKHLKERFQVYAAYMLYSNLLLAAWQRWCASLSLSFHKPFKITQKTAQLFAADPRTWLKHPRLTSSQ